MRSLIFCLSGVSGKDADVSPEEVATNFVLTNGSGGSVIVNLQKLSNELGKRVA